MHVNRYQAFVVHLTASVAIVAVFLLLTFFVWYPAPLFKVEGTRSVIQILLGVDIVLGPLLTLVVFKPGKPGLKMDLAIIIAIQLSALIYGANVVFRERPAIVSFALDRFVVISRAEMKELGMSKLDTKQVKLNTVGPTYVYTEQPDDPQEAEKLLFEALDGKPDIDKRPEYYRDFQDNIEKSFVKAMDLRKYAENSEHAREEIEKYLKKSDKSYDDIAAYPVVGKHHDMVLVVDKQSKSVAGSIDINPWEKQWKGQTAQPIWQTRLAHRVRGLGATGYR